MRYREGCESWFAAGSLHALDFTKAAYAHFYKKPAPADQEELLGALPSVTETLCKLIWEMQKYKTSNLIIDLRDNTGGNDNMASILIYFLYGNRAMQSIYNGYTIIKYSDLYFKTYRKNSLKKVNLDREFPFVTGDYDFTDEAAYHSIKRAKSNHPAEAGGKNALKLAQKMPTFYKIYKTTQYHKPVYKLKKVFVLVSPGTYSSGFSTLVDLMKAGAVSVGTPSAQAGNNFTDILLFNLKNTGIQCGVSHKMNLTFPADARKGNLLEPDYKLTYDKYRYYDFDPNAEILLALELLGEK